MENMEEDQQYLKYITHSSIVKTNMRMLVRDVELTLVLRTDSMDSLEVEDPFERIWKVLNTAIDKHELMCEVFG
jgi:hypothetical protein